MSENSKAIVPVEKTIMSSATMMKAELKRLKQLSLSSKELKINGVDYKAGFDAVHDKQQEMVKARTALNKIRMAHTKPLDEEKDRAIAVEREMVKIFSDDEARLTKMKKDILDERQRIKDEEARKAREKLRDRVDRVTQFNARFDLFELEQMTDAAFDVFLNSAMVAYTKHEEEQKRMREELNQKSAIAKDLTEFGNAISIPSAGGKISFDKAKGADVQASVENFEIDFDTPPEKLSNGGSDGMKDAENNAENFSKLQAWLENKGFTKDKNCEFHLDIDEDGRTKVYHYIGTFDPYEENQ